MTPEQRELVINLALDRISHAEFVASYGMDPRGTPGFGLPLLQEALASGEPSEVECTMILVGLFEGWSRQHVPVLCELMLAPWHTQYENIASELQRIRDPSSIDTLYRTALTKYACLDYDGSHALARKCTWALADIGTPEARTRLEALTIAADETVAAYARKRLTNWNEELDRKGRR